ncbi:DNA-formamidopyrimidine glycosylase [Convivina praedatoris]|uniref:Formamidopyrimidine-DNA glycosylase n=1 Tax=Convivina praedatoris TaxID=2880963 RepID=A0ABM9D008_9LACO|nr:DNA-formamidopyrimidine glycosylase [Convivina sp. LMG 32447]CAH1850354.1 Formamidopyrimidine-DNA glycosylase [Convivina sp. LMG 32447]CAH1850835.1 Formamidopyrimidine-DNA glycosylase [Convivina sp. LMG 32447]CAH1850849.1 Formamidopyrimidine-DNA glycosylase [Convivina sp. LMG 32447]
MPELPEVETVRAGLSALVQGATIQGVTVPYPKVITGDVEQFKAQVLGCTFERFDRRGKYLLFRLSNHHTIVSHLRMEGQYSVEPIEATPHKHTEIIFKLTDDRALMYNDTRRFGRLQLVETGQEGQAVDGLGKLGPEPTAAYLKLDYMVKIFQKSHRMVKPFLLDQSKIAGLGNIYTDEVLWQSKIHPESLTDHLSQEQIAELRTNIIAEIKRAIAEHGTTVHSFSNVFGKVGEFQNKLEAYGRVGEPCHRCGTPMIKFKVAQRGTTICPVCQIKQ